MHHLGLAFALSVFWITQGHASVRLELPYVRQGHSLSCEAAALTMVLRYHGVEVTEDTVLEKMPRSLVPKKAGVWGDPDQEFVGDVDGVMAQTGYGIHWKGLARVAAFWKKASVIERGTLARLVQELERSRPVIVWGVDGPSREISWKTADGRVVSARDQEHTRVIYGYEGSRKKPTAFHVMDPLRGPKVWTSSELLEDWESFGRKGLVLYR